MRACAANAEACVSRFCAALQGGPFFHHTRIVVGCQAVRPEKCVQKTTAAAVSSLGIFWIRPPDPILEAWWQQIFGLSQETNFSQRV